MEEQYYISIKEKLLKSEIYDKVKDYSKDRNKVKVYYETGELLSKAGKDYGKNIIKQYSEKLMIEVGKKYNERNLRYMRQFYELFNSIKWNPMGSKLNWSHYRELLILNYKEEILYYIKICEDNNLSKNQLHERIRNKEYDRISAVTKNKILNNLDDFLLQLGSGFTYIGNEYKIKLGDRYNYIDLFLYNIRYKCYVVIELKVTELNSNHTGQIQKYMNYVDRNIKSVEENDTVGIIICKKNNQYVIDYCSDKRILSREYELVC